MAHGVPMYFPNKYFWLPLFLSAILYHLPYLNFECWYSQMLLCLLCISASQSGQILELPGEFCKKINPGKVWLNICQLIWFQSHPEVKFNWSAVVPRRLLFKCSSGDSQVQPGLKTIALEYLLYLQFLHYSLYIDLNFQLFVEHLSLNIAHFTFSVVRIKLMLPFLITSSSMFICYCSPILPSWRPSSHL